MEVTAEDLADEEWGPVKEKKKKDKKGKGKKGKQEDEDEADKSTSNPLISTRAYRLINLKLSLRLQQKRQNQLL